MKTIIGYATVLVSLTLVVGCTGQQEDVDLGPPGPAQPLASASVAEQWYFDWVDDRDIPAAGVSDMLLVLSSRGRDWRTPVGPDGYVVRAILLGSDGQPVESPGLIQAFLVQGPDSQSAKAVRAWSMDDQEAGRRYLGSKWPGYLLQLDWGEAPQAGYGAYMIVVRWQSSETDARFTRNVVFEDIVRNETWSTTTRQAAPVSADVAGADTGTGQ